MTSWQRERRRTCWQAHTFTYLHLCRYKDIYRPIYRGRQTYRWADRYTLYSVGW